MNKGFGRNYPKGRISGGDDGETPIAITYNPKFDRVIIRFFEPMKWLALDSEAVAQWITQLHNQLAKMKPSIEQIEQSMSQSGAFSNQALTAAAVSLIGASKRLGHPLIMRMFPEGDRGLKPGQSEPGQQEVHQDCLGVAVAIYCNADEALELCNLIAQWQEQREAKQDVN